MTTQEVAQKLVELCREGKFREAIQTLYSNDVVSVEAGAPEGASREAKGLDAVIGKSQWWAENHEIHSMNVVGPFVSPENFAVMFEMEATFKPTGNKMHMKEVGVYTVVDGKVSHEMFLYGM
jgi:hypothetical protein